MPSLFLIILRDCRPLPALMSAAGGPSQSKGSLIPSQVRMHSLCQSPLLCPVYLEHTWRRYKGTSSKFNREGFCKAKPRKPAPGQLAHAPASVTCSCDGTRKRMIVFIKFPISSQEVRLFASPPPALSPSLSSIPPIHHRQQALACCQLLRPSGLSLGVLVDLALPGSW